MIQQNYFQICIQQKCKSLSKIFPYNRKYLIVGRFIYNINTILLIIG